MNSSVSFSGHLVRSRRQPPPLEGSPLRPLCRCVFRFSNPCPFDAFPNSSLSFPTRTSMAGIFPSPFRPELVPCAATRRSTAQLPDALAPRVHPRASAPSLACPAWQGKAADAPCTVVRVSPALRAMWPGVTPPPAATGRSSLHAGRGPLLSLRGGTKLQQ